MDYKLYPIPLTDINRPIYYMVKFYIENRIKDMPADMFEEEWLSLKEKIGKGDLVFPSEDFNQQYDTVTLGHEVIIIKDCSKVRQYINVDGVLQEYHRPDPSTRYGIYGIELDDDEDEEKPEIETAIEPHEEHYYIDIDPDTNEYRVVKRTDSFVYKPYTKFYYNGQQLMRATDNLLPMVQEAQLTYGDWAERLQITRDMVEARVNELHILHNGGLYDYHVLGHLLSDSKIENRRWRPVFDEYVSQLKIFAMYATRLSWNTNGTMEDHDKDACIPLSVIKKQDKERKRRQDMEDIMLKETIEMGLNPLDPDYLPLQQPELIITENPETYRNLYNYEKVLDNHFPQSNNQKVDLSNYLKQKQKRNNKKKSSILKQLTWYVAIIFLMFAVIGLVYYSKTNDISNESNVKTEEETMPIWNMKDIVGSWVIVESDTPTFGKKLRTETFHPDGTWQCGNPEGIMESGTWELQGSSNINIHVTGTTAGSTFSPSDEYRTYTTLYLYEDRLGYIVGDTYIKSQRFK